MHLAVRESSVRTLVLLTPLFLLALTSCAGKGLLVEDYPEDLYSGIETMGAGTHDANPRFLAYGDTQAGWRVNERFLRRRNWITPKAFIFPFYYLYNVGQGIVGTVNWVRHVPDYGGAERRMMRDVVYADVMRERPDFLLHLGDICLNDGRRPQHWATYLSESKVDVPLLASIPVVPVIGNHERANDTEYGYPNYRAVFPDPPRFRVLEFPDLALFVVDSNFILDQNQHIPDKEQERLWNKWILAPPGAQPAWLQRELASHHQRFKLVVMHHPPVSIGRHHDDWTRTDYGVDLPVKRRELLDLLLDNGVQLLMSGHEHIYQHTTVRRHHNGDIDDATLHMVITSGGGAPVRPLSSEREIEYACRDYLGDNFIVDLVQHDSAYHFTRVTVTADSLRLDTFRVDSDAQPQPEPGQWPVLESIVIRAE
jgi:3',5'-cyclic AMP phosphodiesterase CpdA